MPTTRLSLRPTTPILATCFAISTLEPGTLLKKALQPSAEEALITTNGPQSLDIDSTIVRGSGGSRMTIFLKPKSEWPILVLAFAPGTAVGQSSSGMNILEKVQGKMEVYLTGLADVHCTESV